MERNRPGADRLYWTTRPVLFALGRALTAFVVAAMVGSAGCGKSAGHIVVPAPEKRGLLPGSSQVSDHLLLQHDQVVAGVDIHGTLKVVNRGRRPIKLLTPGRCRPPAAVALTNGTINSAPAFTADCVARPLVIAPGENSLPVRVGTTYSTCRGTPSQATPVPPPCLPGYRIPPLPAGPYRAVLFGEELALPDPPPVTVVLTNAPERQQPPTASRARPCLSAWRFSRSRARSRAVDGRTPASYR